MAKVVFVLGVGIGLAILAIAVTAGPQASGIGETGSAQAAAIASDRCSLREVALDQGYGVSRKIMQRVCALAE